MRVIAEVKERIRALFFRAGEERQTEEELRFHLEMQIEENLRRGMDPDESRRQARLKLGGIAQIQEQVRDARGLRWLHDLGTDLRYAARTFGRSPGFAAAAVLTLALGIGATTAIFSVVQPLLLDPLPFEGGDRLVYVWQADPSSGMMLTPTDAVAEAWRQDARTLEGFEVFHYDEFRQTGPDGTRLVAAMRISHSFLDFLGLRPELGRSFTEAEMRSDAGVVLLGYGYWKREFGGRANVLGETIDVGGRAHTVIGVMPARLAAFTASDLWAPARMAEGGGLLGGPILARLRPELSDSIVEQELNAIGARVPADQRYGDEWAARVVRPQEHLQGGLAAVLRVLSAAVGLVLLIASANVSHLLLARAVARQREIAVRAALGAGRIRVARQLLTESALLALAGGALGLLFAHWGLGAILGLRPAGLEDLNRAGINPEVLVFCITASLLTVLLFGLAPAIRAGRTDPGAVLRGGPAGTADRAGVRSRRALIVVEVALTVVLLVGAGLLTRGLIRLQATDPGFRADGLLVARLALAESRYTSDASLDAFRDQFLARLRAVPGVASATTALGAPPKYAIMRGAPEIEGGDGAGEHVLMHNNFVYADYFRTVGIPIVAGRAFTEEEVATRAPVIIVGESTARRLWRDGGAVGRRIRFSDGGRWLTVVGVAGDVAADGLLRDGASRFQVHQPYRRLEGGGPSIGVLIIRTQGGEAVTSAIREALRAIDPGVAVREIATVETLLARTLAGPRFNAALLAVFAALALVLAAVGLYGVLAYGVSRRTREFGIRKAVGASRADVVRSVIAEALYPVALGTALGLAGAVATGRAIESVLHGFPAHDPLTLAAVVGVMLATTLVASFVPARLATRVDPMVALRAE